MYFHFLTFEALGVLVELVIFLQSSWEIPFAVMFSGLLERQMKMKRFCVCSILVGNKVAEMCWSIGQFPRVPP